jgi:hypothetical protein
MHPSLARPSVLVISMIAAPVVALAAYVAWIIVPVIVREVVPVVVRAVTTGSR